jgi:hypothetical protein
MGQEYSTNVPTFPSCQTRTTSAIVAVRHRPIRNLDRRPACRDRELPDLPANVLVAIHEPIRASIQRSPRLLSRHRPEVSDVGPRVERPVETHQLRPGPVLAERPQRVPATGHVRPVVDGERARRQAAFDDEAVVGGTRRQRDLVPLLPAGADPVLRGLVDVAAVEGGNGAAKQEAHRGDGAGARDADHLGIPETALRDAIDVVVRQRVAYGLDGAAVGEDVGFHNGGGARGEVDSV